MTQSGHAKRSTILLSFTSSGVYLGPVDISSSPANVCDRAASIILSWLWWSGVLLDFLYKSLYCTRLLEAWLVQSDEVANNGEGHIAIGLTGIQITEQAPAFHPRFDEKAFHSRGGRGDNLIVYSAKIVYRLPRGVPMVDARCHRIELAAELNECSIGCADLSGF
jgi:hypothetical protein